MAMADVDDSSLKANSQPT